MIVFVGLGASLGNRRAALERALRQLHVGVAGFRLDRVSPLYACAPAGDVAQREFLNAAARLRGAGSLEALLEALHEIEARAGRQRRVRWEDRELDLDVLCAYDASEEVLRADAPRLPHPRLLERDFVLRPLLDLQSNLRSGGRDLADALETLGPTARTIQACVGSIEI